LINVGLDENGYVYGFLPASPDRENEKTLGLVAHMDTSPDVSGENAKPAIIEYTGGDITLANGTKTAENVFPFLKNYVGQQLIVTDGNTLLGADDKAGIAEIFTALEYLVNNPDVSHRAISVCITPDEEIGQGADRFDYARFAASEAYTVDGGAVGEIEYENFNAAGATFTIKGINIHPGSAKGKMKNAVLVANTLISALPENETPATTEGYEGFYHVTDIEGNESAAEIRMLIRDHDIDKFNARKEFLNKLVSYLNSIYGEGTVSLEIKDSYFNMKEKILPVMYLIDNAKTAMEKSGVTPIIIPIRGGTDGARLSYQGVPCPNLSTGCENAHSVHEFVSVPALEKMVDVIILLTTMKGENSWEKLTFRAVFGWRL
ncbi:MAG: peptidase T, partial [Acutalibacteraceae bacterium]|nr:peptidase T [Acutalibacteraceae bacterium]